ncbi:pyridoxine 4-dehydrogenase [Capronia epimyces CBS 606.96]|uniref:Pyridoxine 4-dehydrogenase n=1 Tax=Capronia epimyces CBS 606.96 TaxID=1182542 RepID=W9Y9H5_9EURO|nr:pyridoxine 4-dehydrogenase [Capronia epimyces CBS 606.96]EXJ79039.1 pyridoxine 4-dehydrogenase [Capronia epimyces CBS 606.96]
MPELVGKQIGSTGYGLMGFTSRSPPVPIEQAFKAMRAALESGCNFWNAGEFYGTPEWNTQTLLAAYFKRYPEDADKVVLSVKGAFDYATFRPDGSPEGIKRSLDRILKDLDGTKKVDIFECARVDPNTPLEVTLKYLEEQYVNKGIIRGIALSEVNAESIRQAVKVTKIVAVEIELSLWATHVLENGVAATCAELNIPLIAYSPIGQGMLSGQLKSVDDLPEGDHRRFYPRFQPDTFPINLQLVDELQALAKEKGCTPAQLAISWTKSLAKKPSVPLVIPIPGATTDTRVRENAQGYELTSAELAAIDAILAKFTIVGRRYPEGIAIDT